MNRDVIELWGDIGSENYWHDLPVYKSNSPVPFESVYVPFSERWPQPGFIGERHFDSAVRVLVIGQNPRASNNPQSMRGDVEMFELIRRHSRSRSATSLLALFSMMRRFMSGKGYGPPWGVVEDMEMHIHLDLDNIAYLNVIPLATHDDKISLATCKYTYERSTRLQLALLEPHRILFHGKAPYDEFRRWDRESARWDSAYLERIYGTVKYDPVKFTEVRKWLRK